MKAFDSIFQLVPELKTYDNAVKRIPQTTDAGKKMFSVCIQNSVKDRQLPDKVAFIEHNPFLQNEMKYDYVQFARNKMQTPTTNKTYKYDNFTLQHLPGSSEVLFNEDHSITFSQRSSYLSSTKFMDGCLLSFTIPITEKNDVLFIGLLAEDYITKYVWKCKGHTVEIDQTSFPIQKETTHLSLCYNKRQILCYIQGRHVHTITPSPNSKFCVYLEVENEELQPLSTSYTVSNVRLVPVK